jgi:uncharacterized tellurite resistance protein B-like protein
MIIAIITALAGLIWALTALRNTGFQFSSLNPFLAIRRWRWSRDFGAKPIFKLTRPMDAAAVVLVAIAKADGVMSSEQKQTLLTMFQHRFEMSANEASDMLTSTIYLLRDELSIAEDVDKIFERSAARFEPQQVGELMGMMRQLASMDGSINAEQARILAATETFFARIHAPQKKWA